MADTIASAHLTVLRPELLGPNDHVAAAADIAGGALAKMRADADLITPINTRPRDVSGKVTATQPLELYDSDRDKAAGEPQASTARASAGDTEKKLEVARAQFGKAQTPEQKEAALQSFESIIASADKNAASLQQEAKKAADQVSPGASEAARDLNGAVTKLAGEQSKLTPEQMDKISGDLEKWSSGTAADKEAVEESLRTKGFKPLADAMAGCDKVQRDHADVFKRGEQTEDYMKSHFGQAMTDTLKARLDAREDYQFALNLIGRTGDAARVAKEEEAIIADAHYTIETSRQDR